MLKVGSWGSLLTSFVMSSASAVSGLFSPSGAYLTSPSGVALTWPGDSLDAVAGTPGLLAWYDASSSQYAIDSGAGACSQLTDRSGNGRHLTQSTSSNRPTITPALMNSVQGLSFDGSNDYMDCSYFDETVLGQESEYTLFMVAKLKTPDPTTASSTNQILGFGGVVASTDRGKFAIIQPRDTPQNVYSSSQGSGSSADTQETGGVPFVYHETGAAGTNGSLNWYINNVLKKTYPTTVTSRVNTSQSYFHLHLGADPFLLGTRNGVMDFGELCIFNRVLSSTEQTTVHNYLKSKWGI